MDKGNKETIRLDDALKEVFAKQAEHAPQLPADFSQRVADAMQTRRRKTRLRTIVGWSTLGAVAACLLLVFWLRPSKSPLKGDLTTRNIEERSERVPTVSSDSLVFEPIYKQIAQFSTSIPDAPNKGFPHRGGTGGGSVSLYHPHQHTSMQGKARRVIEHSFDIEEPHIRNVHHDNIRHQCIHQMIRQDQHRHHLQATPHVPTSIHLILPLGEDKVYSSCHHSHHHNAIPLRHQHIIGQSLHGWKTCGKEKEGD